jgi:hypothetical protein
MIKDERKLTITIKGKEIELTLAELQELYDEIAKVDGINKRIAVLPNPWREPSKWAPRTPEPWERTRIVWDQGTHDPGPLRFHNIDDSNTTFPNTVQSSVA